MKQKRKVIHLYIKGSEKHFYFGSIKAMYSNIDVDQVGIQYQSVVNYFNSTETDTYENAKCVIRKGVLVSQDTNRGIR